MSDQAVKDLVRRAMRDPNFRERLWSDYSGALSGYDLTLEERDMLSRLRMDELPTFAERLGLGTARDWNDNPGAGAEESRGQ